MYNPRFPHKLKIIRVARDTAGDIIYDATGAERWDTVTLRKVVMRGTEPQRDADGRFITECVQCIPYGNRTATENTAVYGDAMMFDAKIATPLFLTEILPGDRMVMTDYERTFTGTVVKKVSFNWGTNIWYKEVRN